MEFLRLSLAVGSVYPHDDSFLLMSLVFNPEENPLDVPLVQVSLYNNEDPNKHYELGQAISKLRSEGVVIIGSGMAVHNLR